MQTLELSDWISIMFLMKKSPFMKMKVQLKVGLGEEIG